MLRLKVKLAFLLHYDDLLESAVVNKGSKDGQPGQENQGCSMDHVRVLGMDYTIRTLWNINNKEKNQWRQI